MDKLTQMFSNDSESDQTAPKKKLFSFWPFSDNSSDKPEQPPNALSVGPFDIPAAPSVPNGPVSIPGRPPMPMPPPQQQQSQQQQSQQQQSQQQPSQQSQQQQPQQFTPTAGGRRRRSRQAYKNKKRN